MDAGTGVAVGATTGTAVGDVVDVGAGASVALGTGASVAVGTRASVAVGAGVGVAGGTGVDAWVGAAAVIGVEVGASDSPPQARPARARLNTNSAANHTGNFRIWTSLLSCWVHLDAAS